MPRKLSNVNYSIKRLYPHIKYHWLYPHIKYDFMLHLFSLPVKTEDQALPPTAVPKPLSQQRFPKVPNEKWSLTCRELIGPHGLQNKNKHGYRGLLTLLCDLLNSLL